MNKEHENTHSLPNDSQDNAQDYTQLLQQEYYEKFKMGLNIYEQSATLSRISLVEKTCEDNNNTFSQINIKHLQEQLSDQILKNQILEKKIEYLSKELTGTFNHVTLLQKQNEVQYGLLKDANEKLQKKTKIYDIEKILNHQLKRQISELQILNNNYLDQIAKISSRKQSVILSSYNSISRIQNSYQSKSTSYRKINQGQTENNSTLKDSSYSEQKSQIYVRYSESAQEFYKSSNLLSPVQQLSPKAINYDIESRIDSTLAQIRANAIQIQKLNQK